MGDPADRPDAPESGASPRQPGSLRRGRRRVDTRDPRRSRERALKILFQADVRGEAAGELLARIVDDPRAWAMLDDVDPDEHADLTAPIDAADAAADPEPHEVAQEARRRKALELDGFTRSLVQGVADHQAALDELIQTYARRWTVARMPAIDRNLLRLGTYELRHEVTSPAVVINEVIELAKRLSTEDSGRYVNGVLEAVRKHLATERVDTPTDAVPPTIDPTVPDAVEPPPFEHLTEPPSADATSDVLPPPDDADDVLPPPDDVLPPDHADDVTDPVDVLPPPDDEGDAVDLVDDIVVDEVEDVDGSEGDEGPATDADAVDDVPGQQQLF